MTENIYISPEGNPEVWNEKPQGYYTIEEWEALNPAPEPTLEELKIEKLAEINSAYNTRANAVRIGVPEDEVLTWDIQKLEAQAWEKDNTVATPFCDVLATNREMDRELLLQKVLEKVYSYQNYIGALTGKRQKYEDLIGLAETKEEVDAIIWED